METGDEYGASRNFDGDHGSVFPIDVGINVLLSQE